MKLFDMKWSLNLKITFESNISGLFPPGWGSVELGQSLCFDVEINFNTCTINIQYILHYTIVLKYIFVTYSIELLGLHHRYKPMYV